MARADSQSQASHSLHVIHSGLDSPESNADEESPTYNNVLELAEKVPLNVHPLDMLSMFEFCSDDAAKLKGN